MSANHKLVASVAKGQAIVLCPACEEDSDSEGLATVESGELETRSSPGYPPYLASFQCEQGHTLKDLSPEQEGIILESAREYIADALEAMESAYWDQRIDSYRDDG